MENTKMLQAQKTFETFCRMMDAQNWKYAKDEEKLMIETGARGDDLPIALRVLVDAERMLVRLYSPMDFEVAADRLVDMAMGICIINDNLVDGNFDLNVENGNIFYRMTTSFRESLISEEAFDFFLGFAIHVIDEYNDKLLMLAKGMLTPSQLLEQIKNA